MPGSIVTGVSMRHILTIEDFRPPNWLSLCSNQVFPPGRPGDSTAIVTTPGGHAAPPMAPTPLYTGRSDQAAIGTEGGG